MRAVAERRSYSTSAPREPVTELAIRDEASYLAVVREVRSLAERCGTVGDAKALADLAAAAKVYAQRARLGSEMVNRAAAAKLWAERRAGELIAVMELPRHRPSELSRTPTLSELGITRDQSSEWQRMAAIPEDEFAAAIEQAFQDGIVVSRARMIGALFSSGSDEWYTPGVYVEAARRVLGRIDLDPASCATANEVVRAARFYTRDDDGLAKRWRGRVFLNPPFGNDGSQRFVAKLLSEFVSGNVSAAILACAARLETVWFRPLFDHVLCFPDHRVPFWQPGRGPASPRFPPAFVYLGPNPSVFVTEFSSFGPVVKRL